MQVGVHSRAFRLACALALVFTLVTTPALARPLDVQPKPSDSQSVTVAIGQPTPSIAPTGVMQVAVEVALSAPADYLEVRLRLRQPSGKLVYQKTEVRTNVLAGTHVIDYQYDLGQVDLEQGRYPIEVRVLASGAEATNTSGRLLVVDPAEEPVPVAVVVRAAGAPSVTTDGKLVADPAENSRLRDELTFVTQLALDRRLPLALAIPPVLIEEFGRIAGGYETTAGVAVPPSADVPLRIAHMLQSLESTIDTGTADLIDVPYALPDLGRLAELDADSDIGLHWSRTDGVNATMLHSAARPTVGYLGSTLTATAVSSLTERGVNCLLAPPSAVTSGDATATPGAYRLAGQSARVLVLDEKAAKAAYHGASQFYDALFDRLGDGPAVIMLEIGSDDADGALAVQDALEWVQDAPWLRLVSVESLASGSATREAHLRGNTRRPADAEYWAAVGRGREAALAYTSAVGDQDADAMAVLRAALVSESSLFEGNGPVAMDGEDFARAASEFVSAQFALVRLDTKDVTLSGTKGAVPITLVNDTGKTLRLVVRARSSTLLPGSPSQDVLAGPTQNFLTIPIDLGNTLRDTLYIEVLAGDMKITETTVRVQASYMDRLAIVLMVILVLAGLLLFIRRRVQSADAGTIVPDEKRRHEPPTGE